MAIQYTSVQVTHQFRQAAERVFDAWLEPATVERWLFATPQGKMQPARIDARVGGSFSITDRRDGEDWEHCGEYLEIERPRRLAFSFYLPKFVDQYGSAVVRIRITNLPDGGCELSLTQEHTAEEFAERTQQGWAMLLENLGVLLANGEGQANQNSEN